jgi:hypothetical protein
MRVWRKEADPTAGVRRGTRPTGAEVGGARGAAVRPHSLGCPVGASNIRLSGGGGTGGRRVVLRVAELVAQWVANGWPRWWSAKPLISRTLCGVGGHGWRPVANGWRSGGQRVALMDTRSAAPASLLAARLGACQP